jgi:2-dehydro-3-deoxyglucarate aldolase
MGKTKSKLKAGELTLGGWLMIGHPSVAELMAGEGFDWISVDMEHTTIDFNTLHLLSMGMKGTGCDLLARLEACDAVQAKRALDAGADGIIVPLVNSRREAELAVSIARFPPAGIRGTALSRASDYGRNFKEYFQNHNDNVVVVVMLEHIDAVGNIDEILSTPGLDAVLIGPYDLSSSMGIPGQLDHPDLLEAQQKMLDACRRHNVPPGIHVAPMDPDDVEKRVEQGFRFVGCSIDTEFIIQGCRKIMEKVRK